MTKDIEANAAVLTRFLYITGEGGRSGAATINIQCNYCGPNMHVFYEGLVSNSVGEPWLVKAAEHVMKDHRGLYDRLESPS